MKHKEYRSGIADPRKDSFVFRSTARGSRKINTQPGLQRGGFNF